MNYTAKRYLFEQSTVREFFSGAYYDLFLVIRGSGVFRCSEVVLPAQQQNLIILKPGQGGRLEYAGAYGPLEIIRVQLSPQMLAQLSDEDTDFEKSFNVVPFRQVAVRPDSQIYMLLKNLVRKLLVLPRRAVSSARRRSSTASCRCSWYWHCVPASMPNSTPLRSAATT